jgi:hypothetical protein
LKRLVLAIILLVLLLYGLLHFAPIQTWVVKKVAAGLSEKLKTRVTVKKVDLAFFNKLSIEGLMVEDRKKDTLLYAGSAKVNLTDWFFLKDRITFHYIALDNAVVHMNRTDSVWNYQFLVDYFVSPKKSTGKSAQFEFDFKEVHLNNIYFKKVDKWIGQDMIGSIKNADIKLESVDYTNKQIVINDVYLDQPQFALSDYKGSKPESTDSSKMTNNVAATSSFRWNNSGWVIQMKKLQLQNGSFANDKETIRAAYTDHFDGQHLKFSTISGSIDELIFKEDTLKANILLTANEQNGLQVKKLRSYMRFTPEQMEFNDLDIETNKSRFGNYFSMNYKNFNEDMNDFLKKVTLKINLTDSRINSDDIAIFAPELAKWKRIFYADGNAEGTIENFSAKKLKVKSGNTIIDGDLALRGLPDINSTFIDFKGNSLQTTIQILRP